MRTQSVFGLVSHLGCAVLGATSVYRGLKFSRQALWVRYASVCLGAFLVVISSVPVVTVVSSRTRSFMFRTSAGAMWGNLISAALSAFVWLLPLGVIPIQLSATSCSNAVAS